MVSCQASSSTSLEKASMDIQNPSNKRKREELQKADIGGGRKSLLDMKKPLHLEWQTCLDIQSGKIQFNTTRTKKRTSKDRSMIFKPPCLGGDHISLDLKLNLPCYPMKGEQFDHYSFRRPSSHTSTLDLDYPEEGKNSSEDKTHCPSWLTSEKDDEEMVAAVCMNCHMLVMLCKSSPACPNCKFMHPPDQSSPSLLKKSPASCARNENYVQEPDDQNENDQSMRAGCFN